MCATYTPYADGLKIVNANTHTNRNTVAGAFCICIRLEQVKLDTEPTRQTALK